MHGGLCGSRGMERELLVKAQTGSYVALYGVFVGVFRIAWSAQNVAPF